MRTPSPFSPVITVVRPRSLSQRNSRRSSERSTSGLGNPAKRDSTVSSTTRFAPTVRAAWSSRTKSPSRLNSPVSWISARSTRTWSMAIRFRATSRSTSNPSEATLAASSASLSSKDMKTPGSPCSTAPRIRNSIAKSVFPHPGPPHTSVGRPRGRPPPVISSRPRTPEGAFGMERGRRAARERARDEAEREAEAAMWNAPPEEVQALPSHLTTPHPGVERNAPIGPSPMRRPCSTGWAAERLAGAPERRAGGRLSHRPPALVGRGWCRTSDLLRVKQAFYR